MHRRVRLFVRTPRVERLLVILPLVCVCGCVARSSEPAVTFKWRKIDARTQAYDGTRALCDYEAKRAVGGGVSGGRPYPKLEAWVEIFSACMKTKGYEIHSIDYE